MTTTTFVGDGRHARAPASAHLAQIDRWLETAPGLSSMGDDRFLVALEVFEGSSNQRRQIAERLSRWTLRPPATESPRWLSIGCGGGDLDLAVAEAFSARYERQHYVGVDPNPVECARCRQLFVTLPQVEARVVAQPFERFHDDAATYDLIYAAHTFYYVDDVERAVASCVRLLRQGGELVVLQAPLGSLNRLANRFWEARLGRSVPYSDAIEGRLQALQTSLRRFHIEAELDVTSCLSPSHPSRLDRRGRALLDFILQLDSERLPAAIQRSVCDYLQAISRSEGDRWLAPHPVDGFVLSA